MHRRVLLHHPIRRWIACLSGVAAISVLSLIRQHQTSLFCATTSTNLPEQPTVRTSTTTTNRTSNKLGDGCYHVFLDVGANIGVHGRFLLEPERYPEAKVARTIFDREFGTHRDNRHFCVFAFEPNVAHEKRLKQLERVYTGMGWRYHAILAGVSDVGGTLRFYKMHDEGEEEWGFNAVRRKNMRGVDGIPVNAPVIRLATWIEREIHGRQIPNLLSLQSNNSASQTSNHPMENVRPPKVVMKLDVEGMEMKIIPDLIMSGVYCNVLDHIFGEAHFQFGFYPVQLANKIVLYDGKRAEKHVNEILHFLKFSQHCTTVWERTEDESYLHDGIPLPRRGVQ